MTHYTNTNNPIDFPKKKEIPMLEKFAAQSLVESEGELIFSKEKFAELIVKECLDQLLVSDPTEDFDKGIAWSAKQIKEHFGVEE
jgi:hypothetical protein